jgi:hypothetical protein
MRWEGAMGKVFCDFCDFLFPPFNRAGQQLLEATRQGDTGSLDAALQGSQYAEQYAIASVTAKVRRWGWEGRVFS